jgi:hypothetical protein
MGAARGARAGTRVTSAIGDVHRDFHAEPEINRLRSFPLHDFAPSAGQLTTAKDCRHPHPPHNRTQLHQDHHETGLMIFMSLEAYRLH